MDKTQGFIRAVHTPGISKSLSVAERKTLKAQVSACDDLRSGKDAGYRLEWPGAGYIVNVACYSTNNFKRAVFMSHQQSVVYFSESPHLSVCMVHFGEIRIGKTDV